MAQKFFLPGDTGLQVRTVIDDNFTELYSWTEGKLIISGYRNTFADLPPFADHSGEFWWVLTGTGSTITFNRKDAGMYRSNGSKWVFSSVQVEYYLTDDSFVLSDDSDSTKKLQFQLSQISTGTTRTLSVPDQSGTIALTSDLVTDYIPYSGATQGVDLGGQDLSNVGNLSAVDGNFSGDLSAVDGNFSGNVSIGALIPAVDLHVSSATNGEKQLLQTYNSTIGKYTGILFKVSANDEDGYQKGGMLFERRAGSSIGDVHIVSNSSVGVENASLADKVATFHSNKNITAFGKVTAGADGVAGSSDYLRASQFNDGSLDVDFNNVSVNGTDINNGGLDNVAYLDKNNNFQGVITSENLTLSSLINAKYNSTQIAMFSNSSGSGIGFDDITGTQKVRLATYGSNFINIGDISFNGQIKTTSTATDALSVAGGARIGEIINSLQGKTLNVGTSMVSSFTGFGNLFDINDYDAASFGRREPGHSVSAIKVLGQTSSGATSGTRLAHLTSDASTSGRQEFHIVVGTGTGTDVLTVTDQGNVTVLSKVTAGTDGTQGSSNYLRASQFNNGTLSLDVADITAAGIITGAAANIGDVSGGNYTSIESDGTIKFVGDSTVFDDESRDITGIEVTGTGVSINSSELTVDFTDTSQLNDYAFTNFQFSHSRKLDSNIYPHIHWIQEENNTPNFLIQYRWQVNGQPKVTTWTNYIVNTNAFTYASGSLNQISYGAGIAAPATDGISSILQVRVIRDTDNDSTEFTGADAYTGTVGITEVDVHYEIDTVGSREQYVK